MHPLFLVKTKNRKFYKSSPYLDSMRIGFAPFRLERKTFQVANAPHQEEIRGLLKCNTELSEFLLHEPTVNAEYDYPLRWSGLLRQTVDGKTRVALAPGMELEFDELVGRSVLQVGVVHLPYLKKR